MTLNNERSIYEDLRHEFTADELRALGSKLAMATQGVFDLEAEKKNFTARIGSAIKDATTRVEDLTNKLNCGYEFRATECVVMMDTPLPGLKTIVRVDTSETVRNERMTDEEKQGVLFPEARPI